MKSHLHPQTRHSFHSRLPLTLGHRLASACALSLLLLLASAPLAAVNYDTAWTFVYDGGRAKGGSATYDVFYDIKTLPGGGYIVTGPSGDTSTSIGQLLLMRIDDSGKPVWKKLYKKNRNHYAHAVAIAKNGDYIIGGGYEGAPYIMRTDSSGNIKWSTWYYDSLRSQLILNEPAMINSLLETPSGKIVCAAGDEFPNNGGYTLQNYAAYLAFDSTGKLANWGQWDRETGYTIGGFSIAQSSNSRLQIAGNQGLYAIDTLGNAVSRRSYSFMLDQVGSVTNKVMRSKRLRDGRMVVIGQSYEPDCWTRYSRYSFDAWWSVVTLTGSSMEADWMRAGHSGGSDGLYDVTDLLDGKLAFVGTKATPVDSGIWVFVTDSLGKNILWERQYDLPGVDSAGYPLKTILPMAICATPDSGFTIVGDNNTFGNNHNACAFHFVPKDPTSVQFSKSAFAFNPKKIAITISGSQVKFAPSENTVSVTNIEIFDAMGAKVANLSKSAHDSRSTIVWNTKNVAPGVYVYRLSGGQTVQCGNILLR